MNSFTIVIFSILVLLPNAFGDALKDKFESVHYACVSRTGVKEELVRRANDGDFANNDKLDRYLRCLIVEMDFVNDKGKFDVDKAIKKLRSNKYREVYEDQFRKCAKKFKKNRNQIQVARKLAQCIQKNTDNKHLFQLGLEDIIENDD